MIEESSIEENLLQPGEVISQRYRIEKCLGAGGMGSVYLAEDQMLGARKVALKVLHKDCVKDKSLEKRFLREVELMHAVNHHNVVRTFDVGRDANLLYFSMEFVAGTPLDRIEEKYYGRFDKIAALIAQVCEGLDAIHGAEIIHRDLKPANIMVLPDEVVKITDFGVARPKGSDLTQHNEIIGSVDYISPEVWLGKPLTPATDFYSVGVLLYKLCTGRLPFEGDQPAALMWLHVKRPPTPPVSLNPKIPPWLNQLILKLLSKSPEDRPRSGREIASVLNHHTKELEPTSTQTRPAVSGGAARPRGDRVTPAARRLSIPEPHHVRPTGKSSSRNAFGWMVYALLLAIGELIIVRTYLYITWYVKELLQL